MEPSIWNASSGGTLLLNSRLYHHWDVDSRVYTAAFINAIRCRSRFSLCRGVTSRFMPFRGMISRSNGATDGSSNGNITLEENVTVALCFCVF